MNSVGGWPRQVEALMEEGAPKIVLVSRIVVLKSTFANGRRMATDETVKFTASACGTHADGDTPRGAINKLAIFLWPNNYVGFREIGGAT